jgi:DNA-binding transcriptional ArsR family regulator
MKIKIDDKQFSRFFKAFGDKSRLTILKILANGELSVNEIAEAVKLTQPTVSRHLGILREAGIVVDRRDGQQVFYSLNKDAVQGCCSGLCDCLEIRIQTTDDLKK